MPRSSSKPVALIDAMQSQAEAAAERLLAGGSAAVAIAEGVDRLGFDMADSGWAGAMADAYTESWRTLVEPFRGMAETAEYAGRALSRWAETLQLLRAEARRLLADVEATHREWHQQDDRRVQLLGEADDLALHLLVLLRSRGLGLADVEAVLRDRHAAAAR